MLWEWKNVQYSLPKLLEIKFKSNSYLFFWIKKWSYLNTRWRTKPLHTNKVDQFIFFRLNYSLILKFFWIIWNVIDMKVVNKPFESIFFSHSIITTTKLHYRIMIHVFIKTSNINFRLILLFCTIEKFTLFIIALRRAVYIQNCWRKNNSLACDQYPNWQ